MNDANLDPEHIELLLGVFAAHALPRHLGAETLCAHISLAPVNVGEWPAPL